MPRDAASSCWVGDLGGYISAGPASAWAMAVRRGENSWGTPHKQTSAWVWGCVVWWERFSVRNYVCGTRSISKNELRPARPPHPPQGHGPGTDPFNCLNILGMPRDFVFTKVFLFLCLWTLSKELYRYLREVTPFMCRPVPGGPVFYQSIF